MKFKIKRICDGAVIPDKAYTKDAGWDLYSTEDVDIKPGETKKIPTGICIQPINDDPFKTIVLSIRERGGLGSKGLSIRGGVGDEGFCDEYKVMITNLNMSSVLDCMIEPGRVTTLKECISENTYHVKKGDKVGQLLVHELVDVEFEEVDELEETERGENGFGSSD